LFLTEIYEQVKQKGEAITGKHMKRGLWGEFLGLFMYLFVSSLTSYYNCAISKIIINASQRTVQTSAWQVSR